MLHPEAGRRDRELTTRRQPTSMRDGEKRNAVEINLAQPGPFPERQARRDMTRFVDAKADGGAGQEYCKALPIR
jgi:hypothetical protein